MRHIVIPPAKPPPVAVRKTKALPCAGIDLRVAEISPLPWVCQVQTERRDRNERMAKPILREVVLPVPRGDRTEVSWQAQSPLKRGLPQTTRSAGST
jgi:hypothetical protein